MKVLSHFVLWSFGIAKAWTYYSGEECQCLEKWASGKKRLMEIGCWQGVNTSRLRKGMDSSGILFAVDPYRPGRLGFSAPGIIARREVNKIRNGNVEWLRMTDLEAAAEFERRHEAPLDFIFSDSLNTWEGLKASWSAWSKNLAPCGIYIIANSVPTSHRPIDQAGSVLFTRDVIVHDPRFILRETAGTFTVLERRA